MTHFATIRIDAKTKKRIKSHVKKFHYTIKSFMSLAAEEQMKKDIAMRKISEGDIPLPSDYIIHKDIGILKEDGTIEKINFNQNKK